MESQGKLDSEHDETLRQKDMLSQDAVRIESKSRSLELGHGNSRLPFHDNIIGAVEGIEVAELRKLAAKNNVTCILVFGDSSVDPGNNNHLPTINMSITCLMGWTFTILYLLAGFLMANLPPTSLRRHLVT
ncbi:hypothetical protein HAX54_042894 [Datura stramonium]|uniref:Uncharacterized protein n=1 Tax=Datura stramonium TaxID=4076 RepID=A0ABS8W243_DATST|nr:hypothetical protein [Datura stramonium]